MLNACFRAFGTILTAKVMTHKATGASKGFGFVGYDNAASALKAIDAMNGYEVSGKRLKVQLKSEGKGHGKEEEEQQHGPAGCNLFVYYCPDRWGDEDMKEVSYIVVYTIIYTTTCPHYYYMYVLILLYMCADGTGACVGVPRVRQHSVSDHHEEQGNGAFEGLRVREL